MSSGRMQWFWLIIPGTLPCLGERKDSPCQVRWGRGRWHREGIWGEEGLWAQALVRGTGSESLCSCSQHLGLSFRTFCQLPFLTPVCLCVLLAGFLTWFLPPVAACTSNIPGLTFLLASSWQLLLPFCPETNQQRAKGTPWFHSWKWTFLEIHLHPEFCSSWEGAPIRTWENFGLAGFGFPVSVHPHHLTASWEREQFGSILP